MASSNMYRIGDYVYFENSSSNPYLIRRIEELNKTTNGNVEAKVICFYRRRDISTSLLQLADKHAKDMEEDMDAETTSELTEADRHQLNHRELYLSRQLDTLPATHIRGKCSVTLLNETEDLRHYICKEDTFFYSLVYDPAQKTLLADKGEIRVGSKYQAEIPPLLGGPDPRDSQILEVPIWTNKSSATTQQIDQFLVIARSVGTFARALDCNSSIRQPSLHMSAAAASRDITLFHAMDTLHNSGYDMSKAISNLVPRGGPVLCKDEMEEWSPSEAGLFEEALEKYGKDFADIRQDFLAWKSLASIVEYYYMWKTSDRYVQQKRLKAAEAESKLKQVYIPNYNKPNPNQIKVVNGDSADRLCEGCFTSNSYNWFSWGPPQMGCRLCATCWMYWKKYGGLKMPPNSRSEKLQNHKIKGTDKELRYRPPHQILPMSMNHHHGSNMRGGSQRISLKTKQAFFLCATKLTRVARRLCSDILGPRRYSRRPFHPINIAAIKAECQLRFPNTSPEQLVFTPKKWPPLSTVVVRLITLATNKTKLDRSLPAINSNKSILGTSSHNNPMARNKTSPMAGSKRPRENGVTGKNGHISGNQYKIQNGPQKKKRCVNANDVSDDMFFVCTDKVREFRKQITVGDQRSAARRPQKSILVMPTKALQEKLALILPPDSRSKTSTPPASATVSTGAAVQEPIVIDD
uniref:metastasis-associated protein MTA3-like isoform X1 n=2 Tax=Styela clava TaxID=7725 RepID=UPI00193AD02D|nr:metastasis-associated protein MTA3-like isoform X1 [Styela clava]